MTGLDENDNRLFSRKDIRPYYLGNGAEPLPHSQVQLAKTLLPLWSAS